MLSLAFAPWASSARNKDKTRIQNTYFRFWDLFWSTSRLNLLAYSSIWKWRTKTSNTQEFIHLCIFFSITDYPTLRVREPIPAILGWRWNKWSVHHSLIKIYNFELPIRQLSVKGHETNNNKGKTFKLHTDCQINKQNLTFHHMKEVLNSRLV